MTRTAVVAGGTGLVGHALVRRLLARADYAKVILLGRRDPGFADPKLVVLRSELDDIAALGPALAADDAYCCLGTTTAKAGKVGLERVDYHMVVDFARAARAAGATRLLVVSAAGASTRSPAFYSRVKARMEQAVAEIDFDGVDIVRPSLLIGARSESRPMEALAQRLAPLLAPLCVGPLRPYRPITADAVAATMVDLALAAPAGLRIHALPR